MFIMPLNAPSKKEDPTSVGAGGRRYLHWTKIPIRGGRGVGVPPKQGKGTLTMGGRMKALGNIMRQRRVDKKRKGGRETVSNPLGELPSRT